MKQPFKSLMALYEEVQSPTSTDEYLYLLGFSQHRDSMFLEACVTDTSKLPELAAMIMKEDMLVDKVISAKQVSDSAVQVEFDHYGTGDIDTKRLYITKIKILK